MDEQLKIINDRINELDAKKRIEKFREEIKENPMLKDAGMNELVSPKRYLFWKIFAILCFLLILGIAGFYGYLAMKGKLNQEIVINNSVMNNMPEVKVSNDYEFNPSINNDYKDYNNYTIYVNNFVSCRED